MKDVCVQCGKPNDAAKYDCEYCFKCLTSRWLNGNTADLRQAVLDKTPQKKAMAATATSVVHCESKAQAIESKAKGKGAKK